MMSTKLNHESALASGWAQAQNNKPNLKLTRNKAEYKQSSIYNLRNEDQNRRKGGQRSQQPTLTAACAKRNKQIPPGGEAEGRSWDWPQVQRNVTGSDWKSEVCSN